MPSDFILSHFPPPYPSTPITRLLLPFHWFPSLFYISYSLLRFFFFWSGYAGGVHMKVPVCRCKCGSAGACVQVEIHLCKCLCVGANKYLWRCVYACVHARVRAHVQVHMKAREWSIVPSSEMNPPPLRQGPSVAGRSDQQLGYMAIQ